MAWNNAKAIPTVAVTDLEEAKRFYGNTLGLEDSGLSSAGMPDHVVYRVGDSHVCVYRRPEPAGSQATVFALEVDDVEQTVEELRQKGVKFEEYDIPEMRLKTQNGVATINGAKSAWFKDPSGNILSIDNGLKAALGDVETVAR